MRLVWACGIENRQAATVLPCLQASFEDLRSLTGGSRPATCIATPFRQGQKNFVPCDQSLLVSTRSKTNCQLGL